MFDLLILPSCIKVWISLAPKFQRPGEFLGILFLILLSPTPGVLFLPTPDPPSPIPNDNPSLPPKSW